MDEEIKLITLNIIQYLEDNNIVFRNFNLLFEDNEFWYETRVNDLVFVYFQKTPLELYGMKTHTTRKSHIIFGLGYLKELEAFNGITVIHYLNEIFEDFCLKELKLIPMYKYGWRVDGHQYLFDRSGELTNG